MYRFKLTTRKTKTRLSWEALVLLFIAFLFIFGFLLRNLNQHLALTKKLDSKFMVVEGFLPDYTLRHVIKEFHDGAYEQLLITGKPMGQGYYLSGINADSDLIRTSLIKMGMDSTKITSIAIPATVFRDRTYNTGLVLYKHLKDNNIITNTVNVYTLGCHARRSKILFQKAVGSELKIGIIAGEDRSYDAKKWWTSSKGFRTVLNETLAYLYVGMVFHPDRETALDDLQKGYYIDEIQHHRNDKDVNFAQEGSPLTDEQRDHFSMLNYFPVDENYKITGRFVKDSIRTEFEMKTSTDRLPIYSNYGKIYFEIDGTACVLTAYQNMAFVDHPDYKDYLFIPYKDLSNAEGSYGGGRYLDFRMPDSDSAIIDFNLSYNPYCAYNHKYSCPIPPEENDLEVFIKAGEMSYDEH